MPTATRWEHVWLATLAGAMAAFQIGKMPAALPALRDDLGLGIVAAGIIASTISLIGVCIGAASGSFADRLGHRRAIIASLLLIAAASGGGALSGNVAVLLFSRVAEGVGMILIFAAGPVLVLQACRTSHQRAAMGIWGISMPLGTGLMVLVTPLLLESFGWRGVWIANAIAVCLFAVLFGRRVAASPKADSGVDWRLLVRGIRSTVTARGPLLVACCFACYTVNFFAVLTFLPTFLTERTGIERGDAAVLTAIAIFANALGNLSAGAFLYRGVERWVLMSLALTVMGLSSIGIFASEIGPSVRYAFCLLFFFFGGLLPPAIWASAPVHAPRPDLIATSNGLIFQGSSLGLLIGPPALAALVSAASWQAAPFLVCGVAVAGLLLATIIRATERSAAISKI